MGISVAEPRRKNASIPATSKRRLAVGLCLVLGACAAGKSGPLGDTGPGGTWVSALGRDHPLAGRIWETDSGAFVGPGRLVDRMSAADFVILGEKHDNPDHHRLQAWALERILARGRRPALAFEMVTGDQAEALRAYIARHPRDAAGLGPAVDWERRGWPAWRFYRPIAQAALDAGAPILATDLSRATLRAVAKEGIAALGTDLVADPGANTVGRLALDWPPPPDLYEAMRREIIDAHCNQLPESMIGPMTAQMWVRDAHMAGALIEGANLPGRDGAVLIAGTGHARRDQGVPIHLGRQAPGRRALSLGLVEVADGETDPAAYGARFTAAAPPFDFVWFTPRPERAPACERFADQLRRAKDRHLNEHKAK